MIERIFSSVLRKQWYFMALNFYASSQGLSAVVIPWYNFSLTRLSRIKTAWNYSMFLSSLIPWIFLPRWQTLHSTWCSAREWPAGSSLHCSATVLRAPPDGPGHAAYLSPQALVNINTWAPRKNHKDRWTKSFLTFHMQEHQAAEGRKRLVSRSIWGGELFWPAVMWVCHRGVLRLCREEKA